MDPSAAYAAMYAAYVQQCATAMGVDFNTAMAMLYAQQQQQQQTVATSAAAASAAAAADPQPTQQQTKKKEHLELWGNPRTMNLDETVLTQIFASDYFKGLSEIQCWEDAVSEIEASVTYLAPWVAGTSARNKASTCICLLYKLFTLRPTERQLAKTLAHPRSPYVRAMALLFLRLCGRPADLWRWLASLLEDDERVLLQPRGTPVSVAWLCKDLLLGMRFGDMLLPRVPVPVQRRLAAQVAEFERDHGGPIAGGPTTADTRSSSSSSRHRSRSRSRSPVSSRPAAAVVAAAEKEEEEKKKQQQPSKPPSESLQKLRALYGGDGSDSAAPAAKCDDSLAEETLVVGKRR